MVAIKESAKKPNKCHYITSPSRTGQFMRQYVVLNGSCKPANSIYLPRSIHSWIVIGGVNTIWNIIMTEWKVIKSRP